MSFSRAFRALPRFTRGVATSRQGRSFPSLVVAGAGAAAAAIFLAASANTPAKMDGNLEERIKAIEIELSNNCNRAFVFVKPHAVNEKVVNAVRDQLREAHIRITSEGVLDAKTIDENMLIDNHYGAIASKAMKLQPSELNVPDKGQQDFQQAFGMSWQDALAKGLVYNAKQACEKLGITGNQLDAKWGKLKRGANLLKFGGGFYCGQVDGIFVMNGFYMSMREAYVKPGSKLHYFTVEWSPAELSWEDFRGRVLGATDPHTAEKGSVRRYIYDNYKSLGLSSQPNVGENGVHASASPFEAMAERLNWVGAQVETDGFGKAMLASGIPRAAALEWTNDPQVSFEGGKGSLFDLLEDKDSQECLELAKKVYAQQ